VAEGRRLITATREEHQRLLDAFLRAASAGDIAALTELLAADAILITDGGPEGRELRGIRNLRRPLHGAAHVAAFVAATSARGELAVAPHELNGQPALVFYRDDQPFAAVLLAVAEGKIQRVFFHADATRLGHLEGVPHEPEGLASPTTPTGAERWVPIVGPRPVGSARGRLPCN
jgi:RNA polymerase sigma-70 factor, ECF subfamily